jgi:muramoyltetrapeptide carboxypeptidase
MWMRPKTIKSRCLKQGDTFGVVAPAGSFDRELFDSGVGILQEMGFKTKVDATIFGHSGYLAGTDEQRAEQLERMIDDDQVDAIICARGGFGCLRMLPHLDMERVQRYAKPLVGFSDITALHQAMYQRAGWVTFHGPTVTTLARSDAASWQSLLHALTQPDPLRLDLAQASIIQEGVAQGVLLGGNLTTLSHLIGTAFMAELTDGLLLLEDTGEKPYRIDRMLTHLRLAGCLDTLAGLVLGTFDDCGTRAEIEALVKHHFGGDPIPIVSEVSIGHGRCNLTVPLGLPAQLDTFKGALTFAESAFAG